MKMRNMSFDDLTGLLLFILSASLMAFAAYRLRELRIVLYWLSGIVIAFILFLVLTHFPYDYDTSECAGTHEVETRYTNAFAGKSK